MKRAILVHILLACCLGMASASDLKAAAPDPHQVIESRAFLKDLLTNNYALAVQRFDPTMSRSMSVQQLSAAWQEVLSTAGPFQKLLDYSLAKDKQYDIVDLHCSFARGNLIVRLVFDHELKIAGLYFRPEQKQ